MRYSLNFIRKSQKLINFLMSSDSFIKAKNQERLQERQG
jgi:hypothetical protein